MDNHPIPQDITGFQFKLIGDMTVKQFAYVAGGVVLGWIIFILPLISLIKIPLAILFIAAGGGLAFVPIDGRPMDVIIAKFFKAVFSPTQYVYQKQGADLQKATQTGNLSSDQLKNFMKNLPRDKSKLDKKESVFFQSLNAYPTQPQASPLPTGIPSHYFATKKPAAAAGQAPVQAIKETQEDALSQENLLKTAAVLEKELATAKAVEAKQNQVDPQAYSETHQKVLELQNKLGEMFSQKQELEQKLIDLQKAMQQDQKSVFTPSVAKQTVEKETQFVRSIPQNMANSAGLPLTPEFPNLLTGIIKDPRGNPLSNILVEVKDEEGNAVRAFKTNALGHFASATPLNNGNYTIDFEDSKTQNRFDKVKFTATGQIIMPIEVISIDNREELRRSLFN